MTRSPVAISAVILLACASLSFGAERLRFAVMADPQPGMVELERDTRDLASVAAAISAAEERLVDLVQPIVGTARKDPALD